jgi:ribosomal protein S18 acetylase RimI-like enzyme
MTAEEFDGWLHEAVAGYAAHHAAAGSWPSEGSVERAHREFDELLPDGLHTAQQHLLVATANGERVGILWLKIPPPGEEPAFVYDVEVDSEQRGQGYGRAIMLAAETYSIDHGARRIRLHVFGANTVARSLYESLGYNVTNVMMAKSLPA